jgi:hypothetical protein
MQPRLDQYKQRVHELIQAREVAYRQQIVSVGALAQTVNLIPELNSHLPEGQDMHHRYQQESASIMLKARELEYLRALYHAALLLEAGVPLESAKQYIRTLAQLNPEKEKELLAEIDKVLAPNESYIMALMLGRV